jgi:hypothetical protein
VATCRGTMMSTLVTTAPVRRTHKLDRCILDGCMI